MGIFAKFGRPQKKVLNPQGKSKIAFFNTQNLAFLADYRKIEKFRLFSTFLTFSGRDGDFCEIWPNIDKRPPQLGQISQKSPSPPHWTPQSCCKWRPKRVANDDFGVANDVFDDFGPKFGPKIGLPPHKPHKPHKPQKRPPIGSKRGFSALSVAILRRKRRLWGFQKGYIYSYTLRYLGFSFRISTVSGPFRAKSRFQVFDRFYRLGDFCEIWQISLFSTQNFHFFVKNL